MAEWVGPAIQTAGDIGAAIVGSAANKKEGKRAWRRTKVLNQNQIQWRVRDAQAAGIHPLAALGMSPIGTMPQTGGTGSYAADAMSNIGANVAGYLSQKKANARQEIMDQASLAESQARTEKARAEAREALAQTDWTNQQLMASTLAMFKNPGQADANMSNQHRQAYENVQPGSTAGVKMPPLAGQYGKGKYVLRGSGGLEVPMAVTDTPGGLVEESAGEAAGALMSLWNFLHALPDATVEKTTPWWQKHWPNIYEFEDQWNRRKARKEEK